MKISGLAINQTTGRVYVINDWRWPVVSVVQDSALVTRPPVFLGTTNGFPNSTFVFDPVAKRVAAEAGNPSHQNGSHALAVSSGGGRLYVPGLWDAKNSVETYAGTGPWSKIATVESGGNAPITVAVTPDGSRAYVSNSAAPETPFLRGSVANVGVIDLTTNTLLTTVPVGTTPWGIAITPDGTKAYVTNRGSNTVSAIGTTTNRVFATIPVGSAPWGIAINPAGTKAFAANSAAGTVSVIDVASNTVSATVRVGTTPHWLAVTPDGSQVYVSNRGSRTVSVIDTTTNVVISTVAVGAEPEGVVALPNGSEVWVANSAVSGTSTLSVIKTSDFTVSTVSNLPAGDRAVGGSLGAYSLAVADPTARFAGRVLTNGVAAAGVAVQAKQSGIVVGSATTRADGEYGIFNLPPGTYDVQVGSLSTFSQQVARAGRVTEVNYPAVRITTQPVGLTVNDGDNATLVVSATGTPAPTYQWRKDGTNINGATNSSLIFASARPAVAGAYSVVISNDTGSVTSNVAVLAVNVAPTIVSQPGNRTVTSGESVTLSVLATGTPAPTYQWRKGGTNINGATNSSLNLTNVEPSAAGSYTVVISNAGGSVTSTAATVTIAFSRLVNLSILTSLATAGDTFTMGYVVGGSGTSGVKPLLIRAAGPSLGAFGVPSTLNDPKLELFAGTLKTGQNDNWGGSAALASAMAAVGAFAYTAPTSLDAAVALSVARGDNSVIVSATDSGTGSVIAEIYDATPAANFTGTTPRLINVSVLKQLGTGFTAGFVIGGSVTKNVLVRAVGPTLGSAFGVGGAVSDPQLTLKSGQAVVASNDNWGGGAPLASAFTSVGAFALPAISRDAAVVASLSPGNYTVQVSGVSGATGLILVEIYELP